jgi:hypothetical protein
MSYLADWQMAKKEFETATGKKKPSETFLGVFRKSSGLESVCTGLDSALPKPDAHKKALTDFNKTFNAYLKTMTEADKKEKSADYRNEIGKLRIARVTARSDQRPPPAGSHAPRRASAPAPAGRVRSVALAHSSCAARAAKRPERA